MIGKTLAHYEITGLLGKGGMGEVYRARDSKLGRDIALKLLPEDFAKDADRLHRFDREARALASLSHPNVATIHGVEQDGEYRFLVLELVEGKNLAQRLKTGRFSTAQTLVIAHQIAEGMEAAHGRGIIHRDLKPANIILTPENKIKVLDFGLARISDAQLSPDELEDSDTIAREHTQEGSVFGTAPYMSPEQHRGETVDARADIWAFGCVLYEMLIGASPFAASSSAEIMARTLEHEPSFDALPTDLPPSIARLIRRCLAKDPHQRLHSAADIRIVLRETIDAKPEAAPAQRGGARRVVFVAIAAFLLGALAMGVWSRSPSSDPDVRREPVRLMIPVRDDASVVPMPESASVAISPDGRMVVYVAAGLVGGRQTIQAEFSNTQLYRRPIDGFEASAIEGTIGGSSPFFSPDGKWIGFFDFYNGSLMKVPLSGGSPQLICYVGKLAIRGAHWTADGRIFFSDSHELAVVDELGGEPESIAVPNSDIGEKTYRFPQLLPGTRTLLFCRASSEILSYDDAEVALLDLDSGEIRSLFQGGLHPFYSPTGHIVFGRSGKAIAMPFDLEHLEITGPESEVLDGVVTAEGYGSMHLDCSDDGTLIYVDGGPAQFATEMLILGRDGVVEKLPQPPRPYGNLELSPNAQRLAVSVLGANASIWIYELERRTMTKLISGWDNYSAAWSRDGKEIAYGSNREGATAVRVFSAEGIGSPTTLVSNLANAYPHSWSPDGEWLAYSSLSLHTGMDIWLTDRSGNAAAAIQSAAREVRAEFSPDGDHLAYTSDESGQLEVYVQVFPIIGRKWKLSEDGGDLPIWSRDSNELYYWNGQSLMVVPFEIEPEFQPFRAREVLRADVEVHDYDIFPGSDKFAILGRSMTKNLGASPISRIGAHGRLFPARSPDLHVVLNWFEELNRLAPTE